MDILFTAPQSVITYAAKHRGDFPGISGMYSDPPLHKLGSGGGTVNVLWKHYFRNEIARGRGSENKGESFLPPGKRIIIHSDGECRRLPAYSPIGKSFIPFPVFKWGRGQRIDQTLADIQLPLLEKILSRAPAGLNTLVASGDAMVWLDSFSEKIPQADVVCVGIWTPPETASRHGVFVCHRHDPGALDHMLQKPSLETLQSLTGDFLYLLDAGIWLLSDHALRVLFKTSGWDAGTKQFIDQVPGPCDLYSEFGPTLGKPGSPGEKLSVRILPVEKAGFFHLGSNADLLRSTSALHNLVLDQREIWHKKIKPNPDIFIQNSLTKIPFTAAHSSIWIENSCISGSWQLHDHHIITGIPDNDWHIDLPAGICLDVIPVGTSRWCLRPYGFNDVFRGRISDTSSKWLNKPVLAWFAERNITEQEIRSFYECDIYDSPLFPVLQEKDLAEGFIRWMTGPADETEKPGKHTTEAYDRQVREQYKNLWLKAVRLSAAEIPGKADLSRLSASRRKNMEASLEALAANQRQSIFYQLDLKQAAVEFRKAGLSLPPAPGPGENVMTRIHDQMFRAVYNHQSEKISEGFSRQAFSLLREGMLEHISDRRIRPEIRMQADQILWARSPLRLDLAGGWTDTPPYCILYGGRVVNMAVELNSQPPVQVYIRPMDKPEIVLHSIDLGFTETVKTYRDIEAFTRVGSPFAIPKAALMLAGFHPAYSAQTWTTLTAQLKDSGGGLDISLMVAVPKGSGLGTSSILAATILGGLSECCFLGWDNCEVAYRTLLLEQLLTTGGGWQDQFGGITEGVKLIESAAGLIQKPSVRWAPDHLFKRQETSSLILLYYTGITRVARQILSDIVKGMFLNSAIHLGILGEMKQHALDTYKAIQDHDWEGLTAAIRYSWELNRRLDSGTDTPEISAILNLIKDYTAACKLLGAGGGGYLMIFAKDLQSTNLIRSALTDHPPNPRARFVDWKLSGTGLELTKS